MTFDVVRLGDIMSMRKDTWNPTTENAQKVAHFSLPAFDSGAFELASPSSIQSNKTRFYGDAILLSKLNPGTPRIWLVRECLEVPMVASGEFLVLQPSDEISLDFMYLLLKTPNLRIKMVELTTGTSNSHQRFRPEDFLNLEVGVLRGEANRTSVSTFLLSLEEKIRLNTELSRTLEAIAQTMFKSWFVDFDPVHAKMRGEKPEGMEDAMAALFPDSFEESEVGLIPSGWGVTTLGVVCQTVLGGTPSRKKDEYWGGEIPWVNSGAVNHFRITKASEYITSVGLAKSATKLMPRGTTVIAITGATLGQFSRLEIDACANQSVVGVLGNEMLSNEYLYLQIAANIGELVSMQTGGAQQHINKDNVNSLRIVVPSKELLEKFQVLAGPLFKEVGNLALQSETLKEARDSLLPRLISGELQIPDEMQTS